MERYHKTTGIYDKADTLRLKVEYKKGKGYVVRIDPCYIDEKYNSIGFVYNREYYSHYKSLECLLIPCGRRSAKNEEKAKTLALERENWLLERYVELVLKAGGKRIEFANEPVKVA